MRTRWSAPLLLVAMLGSGCDGSDEFDLFVELRTDLVAGVELDRVRTELLTELPRVGSGAMTRVDERPATESDRFVEPTRVGEFAGVRPGDYYVRVQLLRGAAIVAERIVFAEVRTNAAVTVSITRGCSGVRCPRSGDPATAISCVGGVCTPPECVTGRERVCAARECANDADCVPATACAVGVCADGLCFSSPDDSACAPTERCVPDLGCVDTTVCVPLAELCNGTDDDCDGLVDEEYDTSSDPDHCGACGAACGNANADASCVLGRCNLVCNDGFADCNREASDGCETDLSLPESCGRCDARCADPTPLCESGACASTCGMGFSLCGTSCVDTSADVNHCGSCGNVCNLANSNEACMGGNCVIGACVGAWQDCDAMIANGCEADLATSTAHCGGCGSRCARVTNGIEGCIGGACGIVSCNPEFADCNGSLIDGCETSLTTPSSCGACEAVCSFPNGAGSCIGGACQLGGCSAGFDDCDGNQGNGCETPLSTLTNCGGCAMPCARQNAAATCAGGLCRIDFCNMGFGDCDGADGNGCETNIGSSTSDCGGCGIGCGPGESCTAGACTCGTDMGIPGAGRVCDTPTICCPTGCSSGPCP